MVPFAPLIVAMMLLASFQSLVASESCTLMVKSLAFGETWAGVPQIKIQTSSIPGLEIRKYQFDPYAPHIVAMEVYQRVPGGVIPFSFVHATFAPRTQGRPGFATRVITYPARNPLAIREDVLIHATPNEEKPLDLEVVREVPEDQLEASKELASGIASLVSDRASDGAYLSMIPYYGAQSSQEAVRGALRAVIGMNQIKQAPELLPKDWMERMAEHPEHFNIVNSRFQRFRQAHLNDAIQKGEFGEFKEEWYVSEGRQEVPEGSGVTGYYDVRVYSYVMTIGKMRYVFSSTVRIKK